MRDVLAAWGVSGVSLYASLNVATDILLFLTALLAFLTASIGFGLLIRNLLVKRRESR
jgi:hypothetical protein